MSAEKRHRYPEPPEDCAHPHLFQLRVALTHTKNRLGKAKNFINPNHRHDEDHEKAVDREREERAKSHPNDSFAPVREGHIVKWYVDGRDYFWAVSEALDEAREVIYIEDWWLSPELFLRRPPRGNEQWRLDRLLKRKAEEGVKIYVSVYKEIAQAITCNSQHTKHALEGLCPKGSPGYGNIVVIRHPDHQPLGHPGADLTFYWAHHEKFIVIDHKLAFVGGLDLCFGRWDVHQHPLSDMHPQGVENEIWPGQDFNNNRILDFQNVENWQDNQLDKTKYGRMPWHDVAIGFRGPAVMDVAEHFINRWNFVKRDKYKRRGRYPWLQLQGVSDDLVGAEHPTFPVGGYIRHPLHKPFDLTQSCDAQIQVVRSACDWSQGIVPHEQSIQNAYMSTIRNARQFVYIENQFFITATGAEQTPINNRVGEAIVDAIVSAHEEGRKFRVIVIMPAIPGFPGDLREEAAAGTRAIIDYQYKSISRGEHSIHGRLKRKGINPDDYFRVFHLRIFDRINNPSNSSNTASSSSGTDSYTKEQRSHAAQLFANPAADQAPSPHPDRVEEYIQLDSIAGLALTSDDPPNLEEAPAEAFIQEELYPHSKLVIADDETMVIGSANINDRSLMGTHDSELSCVVKHRPTVSSMRKALWREHLGISQPQSIAAGRSDACLPPSSTPGNLDMDACPEVKILQDPLDDECWKMWCEQARTNTEVYRKVFRADPDDEIRTWEDYDRFLPRDVERGHSVLKDGEEVRRELARVRGHLVECPLRFLEEVELVERGMQVNYLTESIYT